MDIVTVVEQRYGISQPTCRDLRIPVNDVFEISSSDGWYALKLYNVKSRNQHNVQWELDLLDHLLRHQVPIARPIKGARGYLETVQWAGTDRICVLFEWAPGQKPQPSRETYLLLGEVAARIHAAADSFTSTHPRERYDLDTLINDQLQRLQPYLEQTGQWSRMVDLADRLRRLIVDAPLDTGVCHMDLTLDNVHVSSDTMTVFDFDSAAVSWRSLEPYGVLRFSESFFQDWLEGYRSVRPFDDENERAVRVFGIVGEIRNVAWKLGLANSSRGEPLMQPEELPTVIDGWLEWERTWITPAFAPTVND